MSACNEAVGTRASSSWKECKFLFLSTESGKHKNIRCMLSDAQTVLQLFPNIPLPKMDLTGNTKLIKNRQMRIAVLRVTTCTYLLASAASVDRNRPQNEGWSPVQIFLLIILHIIHNITYNTFFMLWSQWSAQLF